MLFKKEARDIPIKHFNNNSNGGDSLLQHEETCNEFAD
jgi:hypothetical protein